MIRGREKVGRDCEVLIFLVIVIIIMIVRIVYYLIVEGIEVLRGYKICWL